MIFFVFFVPATLKKNSRLVNLEKKKKNEADLIVADAYKAA